MPVCSKEIYNLRGCGTAKPRLIWYSDLLLLTESIVESSASSEITFTTDRSPPSTPFARVHIQDFEFVSSCTGRSATITKAQQAAVHAIYHKVDLKHTCRQRVIVCVSFALPWNPKRKFSILSIPPHRSCSALALVSRDCQDCSETP